MSGTAGTGTTATATTSRRPTTGERWRALSAKRYRLYLVVAGAVLAVAAVREPTGAGDLTSSGAISAALGLAVPIGMAGLGGLWAERAGIVNIGLEGMMILGTWGAGWAGSTYGPWQVGGLVHAVATVTFRVDQIVSGVAINILGAGAARFLSTVVFAGDGGGTTQSPRIPNLPTLSVPGVADPLGRLDSAGIFLLSDVAGVLRGLLVDVSALTVLAVVLVVASYLVLWRTPFGLRLRMCGENPTAAETLGVPVYRMKYLAVIASGGFAGLGGAFLAVVAAGIYREGQTGGRGYIGLAAMLFGNWRPGGLAAGSLLFGYTDAVQLRGADVRPLLLLLGIGLLALAIAALVRGQRVRGVVTGVLGVVIGGSYYLVDAVPPQFTSATPYVTTLLVLALASQRLRPPAAVGLSFTKGEGR